MRRIVRRHLSAAQHMPEVADALAALATSGGGKCGQSRMALLPYCLGPIPSPTRHPPQFPSAHQPVLPPHWPAPQSQQARRGYAASHCRQGAFGRRLFRLGGGRHGGGPQPDPQPDRKLQPLGRPQRRGRPRRKVDVAQLPVGAGGGGRGRGREGGGSMSSSAQIGEGASSSASAPHAAHAGPSHTGRPKSLCVTPRAAPPTPVSPPGQALTRRRPSHRRPC